MYAISLRPGHAAMYSSSGSTVTIPCGGSKARPVNGQKDRAEVVGALRSVDYVTIFEEDTAEALIAKVRPAVYAKGGDYTWETLPEARVVEAYGGEVAFIPLVAGKSTTGIIAKAGCRK